MYTLVYPYIPLYTHVYTCIPLYTHAYPYAPLYTHVYPCIPLYTNVYHCTPLNTTIYPCIPWSKETKILGTRVCRPVNHMWQIPRLLTAPNRPCQYSVRIRWLIYLGEKSFHLSHGKHWTRRLQSVRMRPAKGNIHTVISFSQTTTGANNFETFHLQLKYIAYTDTY